MKSTWHSRAGLLLVAVAIAGCHRPVGTVEGTVTFEGQKLSTGTVTFYGAGGVIKASAISTEGRYKVEGVPVGPATITVATAPPPTSKGPPATGLPPPPGAGEVRKQASVLSNIGKYVAIPARYRNADQSPLTYTVRTGNQEHDLELTR